MRRIALAIGVGLLLSCSGSGPAVFICTNDARCGEGGRCEPNGFCSFPNERCPNGRVYGEASAPQLAGYCVDDDSAATDPGVGSGEGDPSTGLPSSTTVTTHDSLDTSGGLDPDTTTSTTAGEPTTTDDLTTDDGPTYCPAGEEFLLWAKDSEITAPMQLAVATTLPMEPLYAYSEKAGIGTITVRPELECNGTVYAWALVLDPFPGDGTSDPDSFYLALDGGPEALWEYGCAFEGLVERNWRWVPIDPLGACNGGPAGLPVSAGVHTIIARNAEDVVNGLTAGIAAVFISSNSASDPNDVYPVP